MPPHHLVSSSRRSAVRPASASACYRRLYARDGQARVAYGRTARMVEYAVLPCANGADNGSRSPPLMAFFTPAFARRAAKCRRLLLLGRASRQAIDNN